MFDYELSNYFKNNIIKINEEIVTYVINEKKLRHKQNIENTNRSICQMIRDININTNKIYENTFIKLIYYIENAVNILIKYKDNWIDYLKIDSSNNIYKGRSSFDDNKKTQAIKYLEIEHDIFKLYKYLYENIINKNDKELILECVYYTYKINEKLIYYEKLSK